MGNPRPKTKHLAAKLLEIRRTLGLSQREIASELGMNQSSDYRISEYESGRREPHLAILLAYARVAGISTDVLIDDNKEIALIEKEK